LKRTYHSPLSINELSEIVNHLRLGEVGLFPTDTVYGLGCRADSPTASTMLYRIKDRPLDKTLPLLIGGYGMFELYSSKISSDFRTRLEQYWPGALTVVVTASKQALSLSYHCLREGTVAMRVPNHLQLRYVIEQLGVPLASSSANMTGGAEALTLEMVSPNIREQVGWGWSEQIATNKPVPSTVVDLTGKEPVVLRQGVVVF
jgi:tRNA threonylcarbamoyl adenosine modification protein (Sua5/YciO/YrdC/YwlC family)